MLSRRALIEAFVAALCTPALPQLTEVPRGETFSVDPPGKFSMVITFGNAGKAGLLPRLSEVKIRVSLFNRYRPSVEVW